MNKIILSFLGAAIAAGAVAQTDADSSALVNAEERAAMDTTLVPGGTTYTTYGTMQRTPPQGVAARAREERAIARSTPAADGDGRSTRAGKGLKRTPDGPQLNVARAMDPEGRTHWKRMNRRSTRQAKNSPPGTVPVH